MPIEQPSEAPNSASSRLPATTSPLTSELPNGPLEARISHIADLLAPEGVCVVLVGAPGSGKAYIAQAAAQHFEKAISTRLEYVLIGATEDPIRPGGAGFTGVHDELEALLERFEHPTGETGMLAIALNIDQYDYESTVLLEGLARARRVRLICTARRIAGAADRLARNPEVIQQAVAPLTLKESRALLMQIFEVHAIAPDLLRRWHAATNGNQHALITLAVSAERRGAVQRARRTAWVRPEDDIAPTDFIDQLGALTPIERETLDFVAYASPVHEPALFRLLDSATVNALLSRHILTVHSDAAGQTSLRTEIPIVGNALRAGLSPLQRVAIASQCFEALNQDPAAAPFADGTYLRLVKFGTDSGRPLPVDLLWHALRQSARHGDLPFTLTLALAAMTHPEARPSAEAIMRATNLAYFLGDRDALVDAVEALNAFIADDDRFSQVPFDTQAGLIVMSVRCHPTYQSDPAAAAEHYDMWAERWRAQGFDPQYVVQSAKIRSLTFAGRLREAFELCAPTPGDHTLGSDRHAISAHAFEALLRVQRGEFRSAIALAENARQIMLLNDPEPSTSGDVESFAYFLAHWARGTMQSTDLALREYATPRDDVRALRTLTRTVELSITLFAAQEGRWVEAAELIGPILEQLETDDPMRLASLAHAIAALTYATLGEHQKAQRSLRLAATPAPGLSRTLFGFVGILSLRARHWLRDPSIRSHATALTDWAAEQDLPLIELEAIDIFAHEAGPAAQRYLARAEALAARIDQPIGEVLLTHIRTLVGSSSNDLIPEERLLSELGVWLPLPPAGSLTSREREIALFTALGYPSKQVAERLHLSPRTVETHLAHVYAKLAIGNREELRSWFARSREHGA
ncbi:LuxR C-terminal-related transcriptional regulator [Leucobacter sp. gxy201]|uniref:helix-turn-helix transcriptional regulator n=1 Tax=Leucobacter sp. gxy201 TaxID=2957200 RepID=UPI003DA05FF6